MNRRKKMTNSKKTMLCVGLVFLSIIGAGLFIDTIVLFILFFVVGIVFVLGADYFAKKDLRDVQKEVDLIWQKVLADLNKENKK